LILDVDVMPNINKVENIQS